MKRFLVITMASVFALPLFGCSKNNIKFVGDKEIAFTAEKPICVYDSESASVREHLENIDGDEDFYKEYSAYYNDNLKDKLEDSFYMVKTERKGPENVRQYFNFYADNMTDGKYVNPSVKISLSLCEEQFEDPENPHFNGSIPEGSVLGWSADTIGLSFTFAPISKLDEDNGYRMEFGIDDSKETDFYDKYFNLYKGETCIATCYYNLRYKNTREPLTYEWFEDYLKENLTYRA